MLLNLFLNNPVTKGNNFDCVLQCLGRFEIKYLSNLPNLKKITKIEIVLFEPFLHKNEVLLVQKNVHSSCSNMSTIHK